MKKGKKEVLTIEYDPYSYIYELKNVVTEKRYIGQTKNLKLRQWTHFYKLKENKHGNGELQRDFNKYGERNFVFSLIEKVLEPEANKREKYWIRSLRERDLSYNLQDGGSPEDKLVSNETWKKLVLAHIGKKHKMSTIEKMKKSQRERRLKEKGLINV